MIRTLLAGLLLMMAMVPLAQAQSVQCENNGLIGPKLITGVNWGALFPLYVMGVPLAGGDKPDGAHTPPFCSCMDNNGILQPGIPTSMWEPARLIEFTWKPGCLSSLGGVQMPFNRTRIGAIGTTADSGGAENFLHYHYMAFPLLTVMDMFSGGRCNAGGFTDLDLMYLSELDPTWNDDTLAFFANPEAAAVANPAAGAACAADAVSSGAGKPINSLFWCAGSWGHLYPLSGWAGRNTDVVAGSSLRTARALGALHRRGMAWRTMGEDAMCESKISATLPKTQYKFTMMHPVGETEDDHVMGESTLHWGAGKSFPMGGEEPAYLIWRWNDCCNTQY